MGCVDCFVRPLAATVTRATSYARYVAMSDVHDMEAHMGGMIVWGIVLIAVWAMLWLMFHVVSGVVHVLGILGVLLLAWGLIKGLARTKS